MFTITCEICDKEFEHKFSHTKVCSNECRKQKVNGNYEFLPTKMPKLVTGKYRELKVVMDLVEKGYDVYPAMFPQALCDIVAFHREQKNQIRIEVKTAYRNKNTGNLIHGGFQCDEYDVAALVVAHESDIVYRDKKGKEIQI